MRNNILFGVALLGLLSCRSIPVYVADQWALPVSSESDIKRTDDIFNKKIIFQLTCISGDEAMLASGISIMDNGMISIVASDSNRKKYFRLGKGEFEKTVQLIQDNEKIFEKYPEKQTGGMSFIYMRYKDKYFTIDENSYGKDITIKRFIEAIEGIAKKEILNRRLGWPETLNRRDSGSSPE